VYVSWLTKLLKGWTSYLCASASKCEGREVIGMLIIHVIAPLPYSRLRLSLSP